jgi:hypothetical protein
MLDALTAGELVAALQMAREVEQARRMVPGEAGPDGAPAIEPTAAADENVTTLSSARQLK